MGTITITMTDETALRLYGYLSARRSPTDLSEPVFDAIALELSRRLHPTCCKAHHEHSHTTTSRWISAIDDIRAIAFGRWSDSAKIDLIKETFANINKK
jgi:hypothetical protein